MSVFHMQNTEKPTLYCPNCVPDFVNKFIAKPPVLVMMSNTWRKCSVSCGLSYDTDERDKAIRGWAHHNGSDHIADWLAVYIAEQGAEAIEKTRQLAKVWRQRDYEKASRLMHTACLAYLALHCEWPKNGIEWSL